MLVQRIISAAIGALLIAFWHYGFGRILQELTRKAGKGCGACGYDTEGLRGTTCPECGSALPAGPAAPDATLEQRMLALVVWLVLLPAMLWLVVRRALEANRVVKIGGTAFLPGYELFSQMNTVDYAIVSAGLVSWLGVSSHAIVLFRRSRPGSN